MKHRIVNSLICAFILLGLALGFVLPQRTYATDTSPILYEYLNTGGDAAGDEIYGSEWAAQSFTVGAMSHTSTSIRLYLTRDGANPGTVTVSLRHAATDLPTGVDIASATLTGTSISATPTYTWYEFTWTTAVNLETAQQYAIVVRAVAGDAAQSIYWYYDNAAGEALGKFCHSTDGGIAWHSTAGSDYLFEVWGRPALIVWDAKIVKDFIVDGDWLVVAKVQNTYEPYYTNYIDPSRYFRLQLLTNTGVVKGVAPWVDYERVPLGIYLSPAIASTMTWSGNYTVRAFLSATEYDDYDLTAIDWLPSITLLDSWVVITARDLEDYYGEAYLVKTPDKGLVLNDVGGTIFKRGITNLDAQRPNLFQVAVVGTDYTKRTYTHAGETSIVWSTQVGTYFSDLSIDAGALFGISGQNFFTFFAFFIFFGLTMPMFAARQGIAALILSAPFIVIMWHFGALSAGVIAIVAAFVILGVTYEIFWKTT